MGWTGCFHRGGNLQGLTPQHPEKHPMDTTTKKSPLASIGIDIGKEVFHVVGFSTDGRIAFRRKIKRLALAETFKALPFCVVGMEACLSTLCQSGLAAAVTPAGGKLQSYEADAQA
jgi:hypothetical protein